MKKFLWPPSRLHGSFVILISITLVLLSWVSQYRTPLPEDPKLYGAWSPVALIKVWAGKDLEVQKNYISAQSPTKIEKNIMEIWLILFFNTLLVLFLLYFLKRRDTPPS